MGKILNCKELVTGCEAVFRGETEEEVLRQASDHARTVHRLREVPKNLLKKMHRLVRDEGKAA